MTVLLENGPQDLAALRAKLNELIVEFNAANALVWWNDAQWTVMGV